MNKKFAIFVFALGIGAASVPAMAALDCQNQCLHQYHDCVAAGDIYGTCREDEENCFLRCGF